MTAKYPIRRVSIKKALILPLVTFILNCNIIYAEDVYSSFWGRILVNQKFANKWDMDLMLQTRFVSENRALNPFKFHNMNGAYLWIGYNFNERIKLSVCPVSIFTYSAIANPTGRKVTELNSNLRLEIRFPFEKSILGFRTMYEFRYRDLLQKDMYDYNHRLRFMVRYDLQLNKNGKLFLALNHESFLQFGGIMKNALKKYDQYRFYAGLGLQPNEKVRFESGIIYLSQSFPSGLKENQLVYLITIRFKNLL